MRGPLAISLALHLALLTGARFAVRPFEVIPANSVIDVSLVEGSPKAPARAAAQAAPKPAAAAEKVFPEVAEKPGRKKDLEKRVTDERAQSTHRLSAREKREAAAPESTAQAAPAGAVGGVRLDADNFEFAYYITALRNKIAAHWSPGPLAGGVSERKVTVFFRVGRSGSLSEVSVETASDNGFFDQSALRAIYAASPVAPLPFDFHGSSLGVHLDFRQTP